MAKKNAKLEKLEEKKHQDLDGDGEKREPLKHQALVKGKAPSSKSPVKKPSKGKKDASVPPLFKNSKMKPMNAKVSRPSGGNGDKVCPACKSGGKSACEHM